MISMMIEAKVTMEQPQAQALDQVVAGREESVLDRLEYGKFCVSRGGPIEDGAGHTILGYSSQFPVDLVAECHPDVLGLAPTGASVDSEGFLSAKRPYGTVLRPVISGAKILRIAYRVGIRSEGGDHNSSRRYYKLGSYLAETQGRANPLTLVRVLPPLQGFTRRDSAEVLRDPPCPQTGKATAHETAFLPGAIVAIMSAIPIHIEADEKIFFELVDLLWRALPSGPPQDLLSAGWNVGSQFSGRLCITYSHAPNHNCAYYETKLNRWKYSPPLGSDIGPGKRYYDACCATGDTRIDQLIQDATAALEAEKNSGPRNTRLARYPDLNDRATRRQFRERGLSQLDDLLLKSVNGWLDRSFEVTADQIDKIIAYFWSRSECRLLSGPLRKKAEVAESRKRLDDLAMKCLHHNKAFFRGEEWQSNPRWRLFLEVLVHEPGAATIAWANLAASGDGLPFPTKIEEEWISLFPKTLTAHSIEHHRVLLQSSPRSDLYWRMIRQHYLTALVVWMDQALDLAERLLTRIREQSPSESDLPLLEALLRFVRNLEPAKGDAPIILNSLSPMNPLPVFVRALEKFWSSLTTNVMRDNATRWAAQFGQAKFSVPALRLASGEDIQNFDLREIATDCDDLPFISRIIAVKILEWSKYREIESDINSRPQVWSKILEIWPQDARILLLGECSQDAPQEGSSQASIPGWRVDRQLLEELTHRWSSDKYQRHNCFAAAARTLCEKAAQMKSEENSPTPQIMRDLQTAEWSAKCKPSDEHVENACILLRGANSLPDPSQRRRLWDSARAGWQLKLLLHIFPDEDFTPAPPHWPALVTIRKWLRHADLKTPVRNLFEPALLDFYNPASPPPDGWKPEFDGTVLWAAFGKTPPAKSEVQNLKEAFECYGEDECDQVRCCRLFLAHQRRTAETFEKHWKLAAESFVLPTLFKGLRDDSGVLALLEMLENFGTTKKRIYRYSRTDWELELVPSEGAKPVKRTGEKILLADSMYVLLFEVVRDNHLKSLSELVKDWAKKDISVRVMS
ncbi:MAG TPA: hypothetical protein VNZ47_05180 [Candidatus Dormibacteraeota bacterium]|jgi:hypothetical protein|nr:hypothetical protein [Candidatus Dormibacteraeota bacterium]